MVSDSWFVLCVTRTPNCGVWPTWLWGRSPGVLLTASPRTSPSSRNSSKPCVRSVIRVVSLSCLPLWMFIVELLFGVFKACPGRQNRTNSEVG